MTPRLVPTFRERDFLSSYLRVAPASLALIRANECHELSQLSFVRPVLDVGCGDGLFASQLFAEPLDAGIDIDASEVARALRSGMYQRVEIGTVTHLPFPDEAYATVFSNGVLEHVPALGAALAEIARVLRPGGQVIATMPCAHFSTLIVLPRQTNRLFQHLNLMEPQEWRGHLMRVGLRLVAHRHYNPPASVRAHQRLMPFALGALVTRRLTGRWLASSRLRRVAAPAWARLLRRFYAVPRDIGGSIWWIAEKP